VRYCSRAVAHRADFYGHVLDDYQHDRAERNDPEECIAEPRSALDIRCPVAGIDETDRDEETGPEKAEKCLERKSSPGCRHRCHSRAPARDTKLHNEQVQSKSPELADGTVKGRRLSSGWSLYTVRSTLCHSGTAQAKACRLLKLRFVTSAESGRLGKPQIGGPCLQLAGIPAQCRLSAGYGP